MTACAPTLVTDMDYETAEEIEYAKKRKEASKRKTIRLRKKKK